MYVYSTRVVLFIIIFIYLNCSVRVPLGIPLIAARSGHAQPIGSTAQPTMGCAPSKSPTEAGGGGDRPRLWRGPVSAIQRLKGPGPELHRILGGTSAPSYRRRDPPAPPTAQTWARVTGLCHSDPDAAGFVDPGTGRTPLHLACRSMSLGDAPPLDAIRSLLKAAPETVTARDGEGHTPLHYALTPGPAAPRPSATATATATATTTWKDRAAVVAALIRPSLRESAAYLARRDVVYPQPGSIRGGSTPLYHAISSIPDDFAPSPGPTVEFVRAVHEAHPPMATVGNASDGDKPLALLYRRFSRQFDLSEQFFAGDNSRPEVVEHRRRYKASAVNTWKIIQLLLRPVPRPGEAAPADEYPREFKMVHSAVRLDCPPDLLRYIVETKPDQVRDPEAGTGRLPLHCAAAATKFFAGMGKGGSEGGGFPAYHSKFVIDELLYAHPDAAAARDGKGKFPLTLAIESGKTWIGGGIKSLYDVYPDAVRDVDMKQYPTIQEALSFSSNPHQDSGSGSGSLENGGSDGPKSVKKEEHHDAIMLVQRPNAKLADVVSAMWANEEDGGLQLMGCISITRLAREAVNRKGGAGSTIVLIAMNSLTAIVNAMKNHPNEPAVQEKACEALLHLSSADGLREVSFAASGAVASIVAAMQAHVSDAIVQREACSALHKITLRGGADRATVIASVSGFTAIQNSLGAHPDQVDVQREACQALEVVTSFPDANLPFLPGLQAASLLQLAAEKFPMECKASADTVLGRISNEEVGLGEV